MDAQPWLSELEGELARRKLPPLYVERFISELSDHISDCLEDPMSTEVKDSHVLADYLGSPQEVAATAATEYRRAHFCRRHPILMFVLLPFVALPLAWVTSVFVVLVVGKAIGLGGAADAGPPEWLMSSLPLVLLVLVAVPVAVCAVLFCRLASRAAVGWKWTLAACCVLALVGSLAVADVGVPTRASARGKHGSLMLGLGMGSHPRPSQVFQFALPLAIGGWVIWRQSMHRRQRDVCMG